MLDVLVLGVLVAVGGGAGWAAARRRGGRVVSVVTLVGALLGAATTWKLTSVRAPLWGPIVWSVEVDEPWVALTFDDGPTPAYTMDVLDLLDAYDAKATFFVTGRELTAHPELGAAMRARGHELGNHSWSHPRLVFMTASAVRAEVERTDAAIRATGQPGIPAFRPPYFKRLPTLHRVLGDRPAVLASIDGDPGPDTAEAIAARVLGQVRPGSVVLLHVAYHARQSSRDALPLILEGLKEQGLRPVTYATLQAAAR